jgi:hypothetical protein
METGGNARHNTDCTSDDTMQDKSTYSTCEWMTCQRLRNLGSYNSLCVVPSRGSLGEYTGVRSGRAEVLACGLFSFLNSDPPSRDGSLSTRVKRVY